MQCESSERTGEVQYNTDNWTSKVQYDAGNRTGEV